MSTTLPPKAEDRQTAQLCSACGKHPRLGAFARCAECIKAAAQADRESKLAAEVRVKAKADRQAALEKLGDVFLEFAASPEEMRFLEGQYAELIAPNNDPKYLEALFARDKDRQLVANEITLVHHLVHWGRNCLSLTLKNDRDHAVAREVASKLQTLFEAELRYEPDAHDLTRLADRTQKQPAKHEFGREKRSLGNEPKKRSPLNKGTATPATGSRK